MLCIDVQEYLPLVRRVALRMAARLPPGTDLDDLIGAGLLGLLSASRQYAPEKGVPFHCYAEIRIRGAILDELRAQAPSSRSARRQSGEIAETVRDLAARLGRAPSPKEVATELGISPERYRELLDRVAPVVVLGFDDLQGSSDEDPRDPLQVIRDPDGTDPSAATADREQTLRLAEAIESLTERQRQVVKFYYLEGLNTREIAEMLGITEGRVSQLHGSALTRLKGILQETFQV
ncbi:MAG TPA: FliA/WhiG family RNA polymerase sigma factor [Myxococcota bacterium]|nr:FliA/WhiG family RNA polymerase sigma factor [Myxococcota bacterium]HQK52385.1 FliA/WhiG family RNA polymerase sigma factor [Myxococcota bacterium]